MGIPCLRRPALRSRCDVFRGGARAGARASIIMMMAPFSFFFIAGIPAQCGCTTAAGRSPSPGAHCAPACTGRRRWCCILRALHLACPNVHPWRLFHCVAELRRLRPALC